MTKHWLESDVVLAVKVLRTNPQLSLRKVAQIYHVPRTTLAARLHGTPSRQDSIANSQKITPLEESVIIWHILDLDSWVFPPRMSAVEDIANRILELRNGGHVGKNWTSNFVRRTSKLKARLDRKIDYQRVQCEDPDAYNAWFRLIRNTIDKYVIQEEDIWNFDKTRFYIGQITSEIVVTSANKRSRLRSS